MNIHPTVAEYVKYADHKLQQHYTETKRKKFINPTFSSSEVQERVMRCGVEVNNTTASTNDELYLVALATLQEDYIKKSKGETLVLLRNWLDVQSVFAYQLSQGGDKFYYFAESMVDGATQTEVRSCDNFETILKLYSYAEINPKSMPHLH